MDTLEEVVLAVEELEALRLADLDGLYQDKAADQMGVSRATFGRIVEAARRKVSEALVLGKALRIEGGDYRMTTIRTFARAPITVAASTKGSTAPGPATANMSAGSTTDNTTTVAAAGSTEGPANSFAMEPGNSAQHGDARGGDVPPRCDRAEPRPR
jgi:predicted DNA-binding protein (UPF0251 family)